jgi:hypothetical protein
LSIGEDKVARDAAKALFDKHPNTSVLVTLNRQGKLVFPRGKAFTPDSSACGCESSAPFIEFTKQGAKPRRIGDDLIWR